MLTSPPPPVLYWRQKGVFLVPNFNSRKDYETFQNSVYEKNASENLEHLKEDEKRRYRFREEVRSTITTVCAVLALLISIISLIWQIPLH